MNQQADEHDAFPDDRVWKAEDLLRSVHPDRNDATDESTRQRIESYFDAVKEKPVKPGSPDPDAPTVDENPAINFTSTDSQLSEAPPVQVPNHQLIRCLGSGGFGQVWLAKHTLTEHFRACKLIPAAKSLELDGLRRLKQRVTSHPNLFPIEDVGSVGEWLYCLMPLAEGASTNQAVLDPGGYVPLTLDVHMQRHGRASAAVTAGIGCELASAIIHLHAHGITHGDIKPANIMRLNGHWTLADYGLVRDLSKPEGGGHTPGYVPPEGPGSASADQYALGFVLLELLTNCQPKFLGQVRQRGIEEFGLDGNGEALMEVVFRATEDDPGRRFGSVAEMGEALRALAAPAAKKSAGPLAIGAAAVITLLISSAAFYTASSNRSPAVSTATPADNSPLIERFEVRHYRYDRMSDVTRAIGALGADNPAARVDDDVTIHSSFQRPVYFYLLSLDSDARVRPRVPASPTAVPVPDTSVDYPMLPTGGPDDILFNLSTGPGTQGFMLLVSDEPLPSWSDWIAERGEPVWTRETLPPTGVILFDGVETTYASATRAPMPRRGSLVQDPIDWARSQSDLSGVRFIAFPILNEIEDRP